MMKFIKRAVSIITTLTICSSLCCSVFAAEYEKEVTMGQLEDEMVEYVEKTYPEIEYGTEEYINFLSCDTLTHKHRSMRVKLHRLMAMRC